MIKFILALFKSKKRYTRHVITHKELHKTKLQNNPATFYNGPRGYSVYVIRNSVNKKLYVGMTNNFSRRRSEHYSKDYRTQNADKHLYKEMEKIGAHRFEVLELFRGLSQQEALYIESRLINNWYSTAPYGYNINREADNKKLGYDIAVHNNQLFQMVQLIATQEVKRFIIEHKGQVQPCAVVILDDKVLVTIPTYLNIRRTR